MTAIVGLHVSTPSDSEIVMTRQFNAPRKMVFRAFTDPEWIARWWGSRAGATTDRDGMLKSGMETGAAECFKRLDALLGAWMAVGN